MNLLILAAFEPELAPLRAVAPRTWILEAAGIGLAEASARTALLLASLKPKPDHVLFVGSCGSSIDTLPHLALISSSESVLGDPALPARESYLPEELKTTYSASPQHLSAMSTVAALTSRIYSPLSITRSRLLADQLRTQTGSAFENLELFGVAAACAANGVGWNALCAITNSIGPDGHDEWKKNFSRAAEITGAALLKLAL